MDGAQTRFNNDQIKAAQQNLVGNLAAQRAYKPSAGRHKKPSGPAVGAPTGPALPSTPDFNPIADRDVSQVVSQPGGSFKPMYPEAQPQQGSMAQPQENDPELDGLLRAVHTEKLVSLPETAAAYTKVKLRDHFRGRDSGPEAGREVMEILRSTMRQ